MSTRTDTGSAQHLAVPVAGMTCGSCERRVTKSLMRLPGVRTVSVSAARGTATVSGDKLPTRSRIEAAIRAAGYEPTTDPWLSPDRSVWRTVLVAALAVAALVWAANAVGLTNITSGLTDPSRGGLLLVLTLGLTAGVSTCMAMVGGLVLGFSASHAASLAAAGKTLPSFAMRMRPQVAFNVGRIVGFGVLGAVLGALGSTLSLPTRLMAVLVLGVAAVMFLLGVRLTGISPRMAAWSPKLPGGVSRLLGVDSATDASYSHVRTALIGAATFFLPCGFTQAVQIYALSTASPLTAGLIMATFAIGTTPGLLALASVPEIATGARQVTVLRVVGVVVLAFALLNVSAGMNLLGLNGPASAPASRNASANVTMNGGVQIVHMTQNPRGYEPADTVMYAGFPTKWVIDSTSPYDCSAFIRMPDLDVRVNLAKGLNTVDLPALDPGVVPFTCVMGMYSGNLIVVDKPAPAPVQGPKAGTGKTASPSTVTS